jgi:hypothetical protein
MGRPPLKRNVETVVTTIRLPADASDQIDALAGPNKRGEWIRNLILRELARITRNPSSRPSRATSKDEE